MKLKFGLLRAGALDRSGPGHDKEGPAKTGQFNSLQNTPQRVKREERRWRWWWLGRGSAKCSWAALSGPWGYITRGSERGFSVWSLIAHAQQDRLLRRAFRQRRAAKRASNAAFVSRHSGNRGALWELCVARQPATNTARRESRVGAERFHSLKSHPTEKAGGSWMGTLRMNIC